MRRILCTVILVCAAVTLAAEPKEAKKSAPVAKPAATADVQQILKDRFREYTEALTKRDLAALDKIWAEGYTFTNGRGEFLTKKDRMANIKSGATQFDSISREDEEIRVFGNTAVVTGRVLLKVIYSGKESSGPYRFINVWVKMQGRWQIVANQITSIAQ
jgi:ketosteroid isomerase-like protein